VLPYLKKKYLKYKDYENQTIQDIFTKEQLNNSLQLDAYCMESSVIMNNRNGTFTRKALPMEAQLSSMYAIAIDDFDKDGNMDIILGGNFYQSKPEVGIYDASYGCVLSGNGKGEFVAVKEKEKMVLIKGAVRDFSLINTNKRKLLVVAINNEAVKLIEVKNKQKNNY